MSTPVLSTPVLSAPVRRRWRGVALVAALALALAACGDGDEAQASAEPVDGDTIEVSMVDFAFVGLPATTSAGTRLTVVNDAEEELHEVVAFRLPDDEDRAVAELAELAPGELVQALGEPVTVLLAEPGGEQIPAVGDARSTSRAATR